MKPKSILYRQRDNRVTLVHTEVPPELGGRGIASKLVQATLTQIENSGEKLIPVCPYVRTWLERNPDWKRLLPS